MLNNKIIRLLITFLVFTAAGPLSAKEEIPMGSRLSKMISATIAAENKLNRVDIDISECETIDIGVYAEAVQKRIERYGRSEEFAYLFKELNKDIENGLLKVVKTSEELIFPGFQYQPVESRGEPLAGIIVINSGELEKWNPEALTLAQQANIISVIGEFWYTVRHTLYPYNLNGRNLLNEYSGHMTGINLGGILYTEMSEESEQQNERTYFDFIRYTFLKDDLDGYSMVLRCTAMRYVYKYISRQKNIGLSGNLEFLHALKTDAEEFSQWLDSFDPDSLTQSGIVYAASRLYTMNIYLPWILQIFTISNYIIPGHPYYSYYVEILDILEQSVQACDDVLIQYKTFRDDYLKTLPLEVSL